MWYILGALAICGADIIEWGGIDTPVQTMRASYGGVSMDNAVTIFPAAVFHGALAIDGGDLVLDPFSDVVVTGMNATLREVIRGQWVLFAYMCNLSCDQPDQHVSRDCVCACDAEGFVVSDEGECVLDCHGHGHSVPCVCDAPYTAASQCALIACAAGTYLLGGVCIPVTAPAAAAVWSCVKPETAAQCPQRGNWLASMETADATVCAPLFRWPVVLLSACHGAGCCVAPDAWWAVDCASAASLYCNRFIRSTFDA